MDDDKKVEAEEIDLGIRDLGSASEKTHGYIFGCWIDGIGGGGNHPPTYFCG